MGRDGEGLVAKKKVFWVLGSMSVSFSICQNPAINLSASDRLKETLPLKVALKKRKIGESHC